jgi:DNA-binding NarL/FixJ family response regulator
VAEAETTSQITEIIVFSLVARAIIATADGSVEEALRAIEQSQASGVYHPLVLGLRTSLPLTRTLAARPEWKAVLTTLLTSSKDMALARKAGLDVPRSKERTELLSPRELEIHELVAQGLTNQEIARLLFISPSTAKVHVHHVFEKLGVRSRIEAARLWQAAEPEEG